jgi:DNA-binding response OmpR family regulator
MSNRPRIIVTDSNEKTLVYLSTLLNRMNFEVFPVRVLQEAYELAKIVKPNLIFIDSSANEESSIETLGSIRKDNLLTKTPVVMVGSGECNFEKYFAAGCSDFLTKPFGLTSLNVSVQKCFPNREGMRRHLRVQYNKNISYDYKGVDADCFAVTLSEGGIYLRTNKPLPVNTNLKIKLTLETSEEVTVKGTVIYIMGLARGSFLIPPGMAVQFVDYESDSLEMKAIRSEVSRLLIGDIVAEQDEQIFQCD